MGPLVIVPCGGRKRDGRHKASDLYTGPYFTACLMTALTLTSRDRVRILSGGHGLLRLDDMVDSYEQRIDKPGAVTAERVRQQAREQGLLDETDVQAVCAGAYVAIVSAVWPPAKRLLDGVGGLGYQLGAMKKMRAASTSAPSLFTD